ncbi:hypothetical protein ENSA5_68310 [Enhygromyxa salina]|uniref:Uncharacterized protein n=1 Tax=Enhygromyxa salina TaxID=215803 RepID=A0A2S9XB28_9BACT|nr:hypothetical protein ENSA5_68310 [Enhygromyxa salina]
MGGARRRDRLKAIGARRRDRQPSGLEQGPRDRVGRGSQGDAREPGRDQVGDQRPLGQDQGQRPRPEAPREPGRELGPGLDQGAGLVEVEHVDDQRVVARPPLGREDLGDGARVEGRGAQAIDCLGRERDELATAQQLGGALDRGGVRPLRVDGDDRHERAVCWSSTALATAPLLPRVRAGPRARSAARARTAPRAPRGGPRTARRDRRRRGCRPAPPRRRPRAPGGHRTCA